MKFCSGNHAIYRRTERLTDGEMYKVNPVHKNDGHMANYLPTYE